MEYQRPLIFDQEYVGRIALDGPGRVVIIDEIFFTKKKKRTKADSLENHIRSSKYYHGILGIGSSYAYATGSQDEIISSHDHLAYIEYMEIDLYSFISDRGFVPRII